MRTTHVLQCAGRPCRAAVSGAWAPIDPATCPSVGGAVAGLQEPPQGWGKVATLPTVPFSPTRALPAPGSHGHIQFAHLRIAPPAERHPPLRCTRRRHPVAIPPTHQLLPMAATPPRCGSQSVATPMAWHEHSYAPHRRWDSCDGLPSPASPRIATDGTAPRGSASTGPCFELACWEQMADGTGAPPCHPQPCGAGLSADLQRVLASTSPAAAGPHRSTPLVPCAPGVYRFGTAISSLGRTAQAASLKSPVNTPRCR